MGKSVAPAPPKRPLVHETSQQVRVHAGTYAKLEAIAERGGLPRNAALDVVVDDYWRRNGFEQ